MSKTRDQAAAAAEEEEVEVEIRRAEVATSEPPTAIPPSPRSPSRASPSKKTPSSFFRFPIRSTAIGDTTDDDLEGGPATMRSRALQLLRLPNSAIKETWERLDLDLPDELKENMKEMLAIDMEQEVVGEAREGKYYAFVHEALFGNSTTKGQVIGILMLLMITVSVLLAVFDSVHEIRAEYGEIIYGFEVAFTIVFTIEYVLRVWCLRRPRDYICSAMGVVDISSIVPTFITFFVPPARPLADLATLRIFRVIRVFRVLRLVRFVDAASALKDNINQNKLRVAVFMFFVFSMIIVIGCAMYLIEGERNGFTNIPVSLYWAVVTLTTVGYGDIAPQTVPGRLLAAIVMFSGYGVIACPLVLNTQTEEEALKPNCECVRCFRTFHQDDANFCRHCGTALRMPETKKMRRQRRKEQDAKFKSSESLNANATSNSATTSEAENMAPVSVATAKQTTHALEIPTGAEASM